MLLKCECAFDRFVVCEQYLDRIHALAVDADNTSYEDFHKDDTEGFFYVDLANELYRIERALRQHFNELKVKVDFEEDVALFDEKEGLIDYDTV